MDASENLLAADLGPVVGGEVQLAQAATAAVFDLPLALGAESMRFLGRRWQAQADHMGRLAACRSLPEIAVEQMRFASGAAYDCCDGAGALMTRARATLAPIVPLPLAD